MHDGTIAQGDAWLNNNLSNYATWAQANNSLLIVTFDEDNSASRNRIPTVFYGANVQPGATVDGRWTLHNLLHTIEDSNGTAHAGASNEIRSIVGAFTNDPVVQTVNFTQGVNGYLGVTDTFIDQAAPATPQGSATSLLIDGDSSTASGNQLAQGLIKFDNLFGNNPGQVPLGATILSAKLSILTGSTSGDETANQMSLHRLWVPFDNTSTWNSLGAGITLGSEAVPTPEFSLLPNVRGDYGIFDVTNSLADIRTALINHEDINFGWLLNPAGTDGWRPRSSEFGSVGDRPILSITYTVPEPATIAMGALGLLILLALRKSNRLAL